MSCRRLCNLLGRNVLFKNVLSVNTASVVPLRRTHERYERQQGKSGSTFYFVPPVVAGLAAGAGYFIFNAYRSADSQNVEQPPDSEDVNKIIWDKSEPIPLYEAVRQTDELLQRVKLESNSPGLVVAVSVDGKQVWSKGYGLADIENAVPCKSTTVMRIASISKPLTMVAVGQLWEEGKLDFDLSIQRYVPSWPDKSFNGQKVTVTTRQLMSMMAGIRHYDKLCGKGETQQATASEKVEKEKKKKKKEEKKKEKEEKKKEKMEKKKEKDDLESDDEESKEFKKDKKKKKEKKKKEKEEEDSESESDEKETKQSKGDKKEKKEKKRKDSEKESEKDKKKKEKKKKKDKDKKSDEFENEEYYIKNFYPSIASSLNLFKDDDLCSLPGTEYLYSTYSWNLVSAVVEGASGGRRYTDIMKDVFFNLGLENTYLDENQPIIHNRARYYVVDKDSSRTVNAQYVDNSYKWAGGGMLSTAPDLCRFGNAMLYSYQWTEQGSGGAASGILRPDTVKMMWTPVPGTRLNWDKDGSYAMGWGVVPAADPAKGPGCSRNPRFYVGHTGGAVGASSALVILPRKDEDEKTSQPLPPPPRGVVVAIIVNMQSVSLNKTALKIAKLFDCVPVDRKY